jgi:hypothetical protein
VIADHGHVYEQMDDEMIRVMRRNFHVEMGQSMIYHEVVKRVRQMQIVVHELHVIDVNALLIL